MPVRETGAVRSPCSVRCFFSSLNRRMVKIGIMNREMTNMTVKTVIMFVMPPARFSIASMKPVIV